MKSGSIVLTLGLMLGVAGAVKVYCEKKNKDKLAVARAQAEKHLKMFLLTDHWLECRREGRTAEDFFAANDIHKIAIYGMSYIGQSLYSELKDSNVEVVCAIDRNTKGIYTPLQLYQPNDDIPEVDAVVITALTQYDTIAEELSKHISAVMLPVEDVIYSI